MTPRETEALEAILNSKNYREVCPDTVRRIFAQKLLAYKSLKDADKNTRSQLHQITGAFMFPADVEKAISLAQAYAAGDAGAFDQAVSMHSSTKERLSSWRDLYIRAFGGTMPESVLDLACGIDPLLLGAMGVKRVYGYDIQMGSVRIVNAWASVFPGIEAKCADLLCENEYPQCEWALIMKLLPLLDRQKSGAAKALLESCTARNILVTYPTRTLGGRNVGMKDQYTAALHGILPAGRCIRDEFETDNELCFVLSAE